MPYSLLAEPLDREGTAEGWEEKEDRKPEGRGKSG